MKDKKLSPAILKKYKKIIDEWFITKPNNFNGTQAYKKFYKNVSDSTAATNFSKIQNKTEIVKYINSKHQKASKGSHLTHDDILNELEGFVMLDVCRVLNLKTIKLKGTRRVVDEKATKEAKKKNPKLKRKKYKDENYFYYEQRLLIEDFDNLTPVERRSIKSVKEGKFGIEIEFHSKEKFYEMLNKHKGFYESDNKQKAPVLNVTVSNIKHKKIVDDILNGKK